MEEESADTPAFDSPGSPLLRSPLITDAEGDDRSDSYLLGSEGDVLEAAAAKLSGGTGSASAVSPMSIDAPDADGTNALLRGDGGCENNSANSGRHRRRDIEAQTPENSDSAGGSYSADHLTVLLKPVCATMAIAAWCVTHVVTPEVRTALSQGMTVYTYYKEDADDSSSELLWKSVENSVLICLFIGAMTFGIVLLFKYRCMRCLTGFLMTTTAVALGYNAGFMCYIAIQKYEVRVDIWTAGLGLFNFAVVGVYAVFSGQGVPAWLGQGYLVCVSVTIAYMLSFISEWTGWALLVTLAFYDLCAVLTPCGPLKWLVEIAQSRAHEEGGGQLLPGLLYEANVGAGDSRLEAQGVGTVSGATTAESAQDGVEASRGNEAGQMVANGQSVAAAPVAEAAVEAAAVEEKQEIGGTMSTRSTPLQSLLEGTSRRRSSAHPSPVASSTVDAASRPPPVDYTPQEYSDFLASLELFYQSHNPDNVANVRGILFRYRGVGHVADLSVELEAKYGASPEGFPQHLPGQGEDLAVSWRKQRRSERHAHVVAAARAAAENEEGANSVKLGLGDFIFLFLVSEQSCTGRLQRVRSMFPGHRVRNDRNDFVAGCAPKGTSGATLLDVSRRCMFLLRAVCDVAICARPASERRGGLLTNVAEQSLISFEGMANAKIKLRLNNIDASEMQLCRCRLPARFREQSEYRA